MRIAGLTLGKPFDPWSRSGVNFQIFSRLREKAELVGACDVELRGFSRYWSALKSFSPDRRRWANRTYQNPWAFRARTRLAQRCLDRVDGQYDLVYQDGAMFLPGWRGTFPLVSYHDSNVILSARGGPLAQGAHYRGKIFGRTVAQERRVYERAALIFTMSNWLKRSLVEDFQIPEGKIVTVYAGINLPFIDFEKEYDGRTILFIGRNFERKGGLTLLKAFQTVRRKNPRARLVIIGPRLSLSQEGVEVRGPVSDKKELAACFRQSSLFVLPSHYEPFGLVLAEAFAYKTPCIGTEVGAMPEIIEDGRGGLLAAPGDAEDLAEKILHLLSDEGRLREMGNFGFAKARAHFHWDAVVEKMLAHCRNLLKGTGR